MSYCDMWFREASAFISWSKCPDLALIFSVRVWKVYVLCVILSVFVEHLGMLVKSCVFSCISMHWFIWAMQLLLLYYSRTFGSDG